MGESLAREAPRKVVEVTKAYYDSEQADQFYREIWGGEDIHIGIYAPYDTIARASQRTVERMAAMITLGKRRNVLDLGAGYGGSARLLARQFGCSVVCLNLSETQNARNRKLSEEQGLGDRVQVVHGNFEDLSFPDHSFDVVWSQDALLHSTRRKRVLEQAHRVLKRGGDLVFTDPMQAARCPPGVLDEVLERIHLDSLSSFERYRQMGSEVGLEEVGFVDLSEHLHTHYARVKDELVRRYHDMVARSTSGYVDRMIEGLGHWVSAAERGHLAWGILHFRAA
jgi:sarcosine/dimethylglycine N-methyltransferase